MFNPWHFDEQKVGEAPAGFSAHTIGDGTSGSRNVAPYPKAPSTLDVVVQAAPPCPRAGCFQMRSAERLIDDYADLAIRLRVNFLCPACMIQLKNGLCGEVGLRQIAELLNEAREE